MTKKRIQEDVSELLAFAKAHPAQELGRPLFQILLSEDFELFRELMLTFRKEQLFEAWLFCWTMGLRFATYKVSQDNRVLILFALRLTMAWTGGISGPDRARLSQMIKRLQPKGSKIRWLSIPQPVTHLMERNPVDWWFINQPDLDLSHFFQRIPPYTPYPHLLIGKLERPAGGSMDWPEPAELVKALGWPEGSIDSIGTLDSFLSIGLEEEEEQIPDEQPLWLPAREAAGQAVQWCREQGIALEECYAILEEEREGFFVIYLQAKNQEKHRLATVHLDKLPFPMELFKTIMQQAFAESGIQLINQSTEHSLAGDFRLH